MEGRAGCLTVEN